MAIEINDALLRAGLEAQFEFSGMDSSIVKAVIDACMADVAFVEAMTVVATRLGEIAARFAPPAGTGGIA